MGLIEDAELLTVARGRLHDLLGAALKEHPLPPGSIVRYEDVAGWLGVSFAGLRQAFEARPGLRPLLRQVLVEASGSFLVSVPREGYRVATAEDAACDANRRMLRAGRQLDAHRDEIRRVRGQDQDERCRAELDRREAGLGLFLDGLRPQITAGTAFLLPAPKEE